MSETRQTEIIETELEEILEDSEEATDVQQEELIEEEIDPRIEKRDQLFENMKNVLLEQGRVLTKFFNYSDQHCEFDYEEMGLSFEEEEDHLRRTNKLKDKLLDNVEDALEIKFINREINTLHNMIVCDSTYEEEKFRIVIEVYEDSFDLEVI